MLCRLSGNIIQALTNYTVIQSTLLVEGTASPDNRIIAHGNLISDASNTCACDRVIKKYNQTNTHCKLTRFLDNC